MSYFQTTFKIDRGSTFRKRYEWVAGPKKAQTPVDLTGCTAVTEFSSNGGPAFKTLTTENGGMVLGAALGTISYYIPHTDTATWPVETCEFVTTITFPNGDVYRKVKGMAYSPEA